MSNLFDSFEKSSLQDWKDQIIKDLKGKEHSLLEFNDSVEEIDYKAYYHNTEINTSIPEPGKFPYTRGSRAENNDWLNMVAIEIRDEKLANERALRMLNTGADSLLFKAKKENIEWSNVLKGIGLEYITTQFEVKTSKDFKNLITIAEKAKSKISFNFDALSSCENSDLLKVVGFAVGKQKMACFKVNGFAIQQAGSNTWQEIAFCLNSGHETLLKLMHSGLSIDQASQLIHFHLGVGSNYFFEIAKYRTLRMLWSKIVQAYEPKDFESYNCHITAVIGHSNKSLRDPYTNLLRQTTEVMSACNGADAIVVLPYDLYSSNDASELASRMAVNIPLILKEESYLDMVIDPSAGSYSIEQLTEKVSKKAWLLFQDIEQQGGLLDKNCMKNFETAVHEKRNQRIVEFEQGKIVAIGINKYPDPQEKEINWKKIDSYMNFDALILEQHNKNSKL